MKGGWSDSGDGPRMGRGLIGGRALALLLRHWRGCNVWIVGQDFRMRRRSVCGW